MRIWAILWRLAALLVGLVLIVLAVGWVAARAPEPDGFYASAAAGEQPGMLLGAEPYEIDVPAGARAWRILYSTTRQDGDVALASAVVMVPEGAEGPLPVVAWAHGTTGIVSGCAPSIDAPFANVPAVQGLIERGWAYVATDYVGLGTQGGHAYLVGREAGQAVLDAVKAAGQLPGITLDRRVAVWGHSQGGNSALWAGMLAGDYAPELDVVGVAAMAPASDLIGLLTEAQKNVFGKIVSALLIESYAGTYPDIRPGDYINGFQAGLVRDIAGRCADDMGALFSVAETLLLPADGLFSGDLTAGPLPAAMVENSPFGPFSMPVLVAQGVEDDLVSEPIQNAYATRLCGEGQAVEYRPVEGRDHLSLVAADSPFTQPLLDWTAARFAGEASGAVCPP